MALNASGLVRSSKKLAALGLGSAAVAAAFMSLGSGTANAVEEVAPTPVVTSRQALIIDDNALRATAPGQARGMLNTRSANSGVVHAQGNVKDSVKAVVGTSAAPFNLESNGSFQTGAPIGDW
ncbi:MAG: hypothetical protein WBB07_09740 [Mycobacterium sp.]